jgi:hypothetical protein
MKNKKPAGLVIRAGFVLEVCIKFDAVSLGPACGSTDCDRLGSVSEGLAAFHHGPEIIILALESRDRGNDRGDKHATDQSGKNRKRQKHGLFLSLAQRDLAFLAEKI